MVCSHTNLDLYQYNTYIHKKQGEKYCVYEKIVVPLHRQKTTRVLVEDIKR